MNIAVVPDIERKLRLFIRIEIFILGLVSFLYLFFGMLYTVVYLLYPDVVARVCGFSISATDYTGAVHFMLGAISIFLSVVGIYGMRELLFYRHYFRTAVAMFFMLAYSCGVAMMPVAEYTPIVVTGLSLSIANFIGTLMIAYIILELSGIEERG
ncbi:MAG: hypothetical protein HZA07_02605 [Nitrospirae bacterium]|nr:hypothetical protein [Nitrospirota bacterium]